MRLTNCFGMFVKTLALGIEIEDITSLEFVEKSKTVFTDSIENEIYPYAQLCAKYGYAPNIMYEYQLGVVDNLEIDGKTVVRDYLEMNTAKFKNSRSALRITRASRALWFSTMTHFTAVSL